MPLGSAAKGERKYWYSVTGSSVSDRIKPIPGIEPGPTRELPQNRDRRRAAVVDVGASQLDRFGSFASILAR